MLCYNEIKRGALDLDIRVLEYFLAVAREQSITKAAEALHMTQPPLSRALKDLEEELGTQLLIRGRRVELTEDGLLLKQRAREIVELMEKTKDAFHDGGEDVAGDVYIGCGETEGMRTVARTIHSIRQAHPQIRFHLSSGNSEDLTERLDRGLFDFCALFEPCDYAKYDHIRLPGRDQWGVLMRRDCLLAARKVIHPEDLRNLPLIASSQSIAHNELSGWLGQDTKELNIVATYNLIYNAALLVAEGVGYMICLDRIVREPGEGLFCFRPLEPRIETGLDIVWKKYHVFSRAAEVFLTKLKQQISEKDE